MELWMKSSIFEIEKIKRYLDDDELFRAGKHTRRVATTIDHIADGFDLLTTMTQADYHEIRLALGRGSGQNSPGFKGLLTVLPTLWDPFAAALSRHDVKLLDVVAKPHTEENRGLYEAGMALLEVDRKFSGVPLSAPAAGALADRIGGEVAQGRSRAGDGEEHPHPVLPRSLDRDRGPHQRDQPHLRLRAGATNLRAAARRRPRCC